MWTMSHSDQSHSAQVSFSCGAIALHDVITNSALVQADLCVSTDWPALNLVIIVNAAHGLGFWAMQRSDIKRGIQDHLLKRSGMMVDYPRRVLQLIWGCLSSFIVMLGVIYYLMYSVSRNQCAQVFIGPLGNIKQTNLALFCAFFTFMQIR